MTIWAVHPVVCSGGESTQRSATGRTGGRAGTGESQIEENQTDDPGDERDANRDRSTCDRPAKPPAQRDGNDAEAQFSEGRARRPRNLGGGWVHGEVGKQGRGFTTRRSAQPSKPALSLVAPLRSSLVMGSAGDRARGSGERARRKVDGAIGLGELRSDAIAGTKYLRRVRQGIVSLGRPVADHGIESRPDQ